MSYTPTEWKSGDTITSAKLNKIEEGISNSNITIQITWDESSVGHLNRTWAELNTAIEKGLIWLLEDYHPNDSVHKEIWLLTTVDTTDTSNYPYVVSIRSMNSLNNYTFSAALPDDELLSSHEDEEILLH